MHAGFTLADAARLVPYLARLGISHVYSSPLLKARAGSQHGYDVVDPTLACPERGGENGLAALAATLHAHDMGLILDIVPNHMGIGAENPWWDDLLTHGRASAHAAWFDIDWESGAGRVVLPILGAPLPDVVADNTSRVDPPAINACTTAAEILKFQWLVRQVPMSKEVARKAVDLVRATRPSDPRSMLVGSVVPSAMVIGTPSCRICTPRMPNRGIGARMAKRTPPDRLKLRRFST